MTNDKYTYKTGVFVFSVLLLRALFSTNTAATNS